MKLMITKTIGNTKYHYTTEGSNLYELHAEAEKLSFPSVHKCGICGGEKLRIGTRKAQGKYKYVFIKCLNRDCKAELTFGNKQEEPDVYYLRKNEDKTYAWRVPEKQGNQQINQQNNQQSNEGSDLPF